MSSPDREMERRPPRWFRPSAPPTDLGDVLACTWYATAEGEHDLIPDGCVDVLWIADRGVWVCGPDTRSWKFTLPIGTETCGIRFRPGAANQVFGLPASALVDERVRLGDVLAPGDEHAVDDAVSAGDAGSRTASLADFLRRRLHAAAADPMIVAAGLLSRTANAIGRLDDVAGEFGISARHFRRRFTESVGYSPAFYARIARLQRFLRATASNRRLGLAALAAATGYTDQAHLSRDCREIAGMTPRRLVAVLDRTSSVTPFV